MKFPSERAISSAFSQFIGLRMISDGATIGLNNSRRIELLRLKDEFGYSETGNFTELHKRSDAYISYYASQINLTRISVFLASYSTLEWATRKAARLAIANSGTLFRLGDFAGTGIDQAKLILSRFRPDLDEILGGKWEKLKLYQELRNRLVHSMGVVETTDEKERARALCAKFDGLTFDDESYSDLSHYWLDETFVEVCISEFEDVALRLGAALDAPRGDR